MRARIFPTLLLSLLLLAGLAGPVLAADAPAAPAPAAPTTPAKPDIIKVGVFVTNLFSIDFTNSQFTGQFWSWFIGHNKDFKPTTAVELPNSKLQKVLASSRTETDKGYLDQVKFESTVNQHWDISNFPFDRQILRFSIESTDLDSDHLQFEPDIAGSKISPEILLEGWEIQAFRIKAGNQVYPTAYGDPTIPDGASSSYSRLTFEIEMKRDGWRLLIYTFLGFVLAIGLSAMVLTMSTTDFLLKAVPLPIRMTISTGALFASIGAAYTLQAKLPTTTAFTLADAIQGTAFLGTLFAVMASLGTETLGKTTKPHYGVGFGRALLAIYVVVLVLDGLLLIKAVHS